MRFILIIALFFPVFCFSQSEIQTNLDIFDSSADSLAKYLSAKLSEMHIDSAKADIVAENGAAIYLASKIIESEETTFFSANETADKDLSSVKLIAEQFETKYSLIENEDYVKREIIMRITLYMLLKSGELKRFDDFEIAYSDSVRRSIIPYIENKNLAFTRGEVPEKPKSFFKKILEPAIIVTSALITVIVLFTVRSG